jgi:uncharacterized protein (TIGR00290 family)
MSLYTVMETNEFKITGLLTTMSEEFNRISLHGVREELLDRQSKEVGIPVTKVRLPNPCPNDVYDRVMGVTMEKYKQMGVTHSIFGDIFLVDIRRYREEQLRKVGLTPIFPLWKEPTDKLARRIIDLGFKAVITCVNTAQLHPKFSGRYFDEALLADLPKNVDPCGENGEFHTFVYDGPIFKHPIPIHTGETVTKNGFKFTDIISG